MTFPPERMREARRLFEAALELAPEARRAFLLGAAPDDAPLRAEVAGLLAAHDSDDHAFDRPAVEHAGLTRAGGASFLIGQRLGPWEVIRVLGHGGMGTVYEAARADGQFTRRVAIKTLRAGMDRAELLHRFERERRIQAAMEHPNIAALLDAGVTPEGIPYIVLEHVDGLPIDRYCTEHRLGLVARLDLFRQVALAVQYAHQQLVVHRDLKPSNILVTADGVVKLLDFGIAKLMDESTGQVTTDGLRAFTTLYASPEQLQGRGLSTATDIYSLGTVLFRLLTGRHPFEADSANPAAAVAAVCEQPPPAPSAVASDAAAGTMGLETAPRLARALRGELDAIVLMALRKEPNRRYPTADAMAEDVLRHIKGFSVHARPDSARYRLRKFVARNRMAAAALVLAGAAMLGGTSLALWQARSAQASAARAETERVVADQQRRTAERIFGFLETMLASADPAWTGDGFAPDASFRDIIDATAERVSLELAEEPPVAEALHRILASIYASMGVREKGEFHAREVLRLLEAREATGAQLARGLYLLGRQYYLSGHFDSAFTALSEAHRLHEAAGVPDSAEFVQALDWLGIVLWDRGFPEAAEPHLVRALAIHRRRVGEDALTALIESHLGSVRQAKGDLDGASGHLREADRIFSSMGGRIHYEHGNTLNALATIAILTGELTEAERLLRRAFAIWNRTLGEDNIFHALGLVDLARIQLARGRPAEALATIGDAARRTAHLPPSHPAVARRQTHEAAILLASGRPLRAEALARVAIETRRAAYDAADWRIAETEGVLGRILAASGRSAEGLALLRRSHALTEVALGPSHPRTLAVMRALDSVVPASSGRPASRAPD